MRAGGEIFNAAAVAGPAVKTKGSPRAQQRIGRALTYTVLIALSTLFALPLLITVSDSLKSLQEIYTVPRIGIPENPRWHNFVDIFTSGIPFHLFFLNTFLITSMALFGEVVSSSLVGYSFARLRWPLRDFMVVVLLSTLMLPAQVTMIPVFLFFNKLGWVNTWAPLIYLSDFCKYTISLGIYMFKDAQSIFPQYIMAASLTSLLPVLVLFFSAQRYFV